MNKQLVLIRVTQNILTVLGVIEVLCGTFSCRETAGHRRTCPDIGAAERPFMTGCSGGGKRDASGRVTWTPLLPAIGRPAARQGAQQSEDLMARQSLWLIIAVQGRKHLPDTPVLGSIRGRSARHRPPVTVRRAGWAARGHPRTRGRRSHPRCGPRLLGDRPPACGSASLPELWSVRQLSASVLGGETRAEGPGEVCMSSGVSTSCERTRVVASCTCLLLPGHQPKRRGGATVGSATTSSCCHSM